MMASEAHALIDIPAHESGGRDRIFLARVTNRHGVGVENTQMRWTLHGHGSFAPDRILRTLVSRTGEYGEDIVEWSPFPSADQPSHALHCVVTAEALDPDLEVRLERTRHPELRVPRRA